MLLWKLILIIKETNYSRIVNSDNCVNGMSASDILLELEAMSRINFNLYVDFLRIQLNLIHSFLPGVLESDTY